MVKRILVDQETLAKALKRALSKAGYYPLDLPANWIDRSRG